MEYGCRIWDEQGNLILDTNDYVARIIYIDTKPGNAQGSIYLPDAVGTKPLVLAVPAEPNGKCLNVSITSWGLLSWKPTWRGYYDWVGNNYVFVPTEITSNSTIITVCVIDERI